MARPLDQNISKTAALVGCSRSAVVSIYQKWSKEGTVVNQRQGHGRPRLIDARGERRLARVVRSNGRATVAQIAEEVNAGSDRKLPLSLDPLQFAYRPNRSTDDAITTTLHLSLTPLDNKDTYVRMLFIDFSTAFNTIIPQHLIEKLTQLNLNTSLCNWILDFLTGRPQTPSQNREQPLQHHHTEHWSPSGLCAQPTAVHFADSRLCSNAQFKPHRQVRR
ncbi:hypothetical protein QTP86_006429 [Hemibagrus guttatus]|nr:hypothetical protein QTP86_006429 [Hemibagrus guttatus]